MESARLLWARQHQQTIKAERYQGLVDAADNNDLPGTGIKIILPASITCTPRWYTEKYHDAMATVRAKGKPHLFITITANPKWREITESLEGKEMWQDRPDIVARVFRQKLLEIMRDIKKKEIFGVVASYMYTIEWQKRFVYF